MKEHIKYAKYVLRYLKGTKELKIKYDRSSDARLIAYLDSDWGENKDDHHSTSGHIFLMANGCISWASQWQKTVALSVGEAEYSNAKPNTLIFDIIISGNSTKIRS